MPTLRIRSLIDRPTLSVMAVESVSCWSVKTVAGGQVAGLIEPVAVVIRGVDCHYALDMNAKRIDLKQLIARVPALAAR